MRGRIVGRYLEAVKNGNPVQDEPEISRADMGFEFMLNALRLNGGVAPNLFLERVGMSINAIERYIDLR